MKKIIFSILAALCLAACIEENIDTDQQLQEITFDTDFTAYVTKSGSGEVTQETFPYDFFYVWGYETNSKGKVKQIFGTEQYGPVMVSKDDNGNWSYTGDSRYWIPNCTYEFYALTHTTDPVNTTNFNYDKRLAVESWLMRPNEDIMYAYLTTDTNSNNGDAVLDFKHVLSKISLSFINLIDPNVTLQVSNVTLTLPRSGGVDLINDQISPQFASSESQHNFGNITKILNYIDETLKESEDTLEEYKTSLKNNTGKTESLIVWPSNNSFEYKISFDISLNIPTTKADGTTKINGSVEQILNVGTAYNFVIDITPEVIKKGEAEIKVEEIPGWEDATDTQQLSVASKLGGTVTLTDDLTLSDSFNVLDDLTINLNGHTITYEGSSDQLFNVTGTATLTINGEVDGSAISSSKIIATATNTNSKIIVNGGKYTAAGDKTYHKNGGTITIYNGSFYKWDPSDGEEKYTYTKELNFLAKPDNDSNQKLFVIKEGEWYHIKKEYTFSGDNDQASSEFVDIVQNGINDGDILSLKTNISIPNVYDFALENKGEVTVNMNDNTLEGDINIGYASLIGSNTNVTFNNGSFTGGGINVQGAGSKVTLNDCNITITSTATSNRHCIYAGQGAEVIYNGGKLKFASDKKRSYFCANPGTIYVLNCECGAPSSREGNPPIYILGGTVIIYRGTFGFNPELYITLPEGSSSTQIGNQWIVTSTYIDISDDGITSIHGGTYAFDPNQWTADGYEAMQNDDGTWTVQPITTTGN